MASAYGVGVPLLKSDLHLADGELQFNNIEASVYGAPISGSAAISTANLFSQNHESSNLELPNSESAKNEFHLNLSGRNLDLARFPRLQTGRFVADGIADFTVRASGTPEQPSIERAHSSQGSRLG